MTQPSAATQGGRTVISRARIVAPAASVFELLADPVREPEWNEQLRRVEPLGPAPLRAGSRFRAHFAGPVGEMLISYDEVAAPLSWRTHGDSAKLEVWLLGTIIESGGVSEVTLTTTVRTRGPLRLLGPLVARTMARSWDHHLEVIRRRLEAQSG